MTVNEIRAEEDMPNGRQGNIVYVLTNLVNWQCKAATWQVAEGRHRTEATTAKKVQGTLTTKIQVKKVKKAPMMVTAMTSSKRKCQRRVRKAQLEAKLNETLTKIQVNLNPNFELSENNY